MDRVYELMGRAAELPYGETRTVLTEEALRHAEAAGDPRLAFRVRMELTGVYQYGGEPAKAFTTFSRCLSEHDRDPVRFGSLSRLLWHFKWIVNSLTLFPEVPLDRTAAVLDDMERRYRQAGHGLHAVYAYRHRVALHVGDADAAEEWYVRWNAAPRDELSDCAGCDPSSRVTYLTWRERYEDALAIAAPVLREEIDCTEQPQNILTALLPAYLRTGRWEEARDAHRRSYRVLRRNRADLADIAEHLEFCAATGNQARGLEIAERHLGWLDRPPTPYAAMRFATAVALVLRRVEEAGHGDVTVRRPGHGDRPETRPTAAGLRVELTGRALELAARFDSRNGTSHQGELTRARLAAEPLGDHLPLTAHDQAAVRLVPPPAAGPVGPPGPPGPAGPQGSAGSAESDAADPMALLDEAEEHWINRRNAAALAVLGRFDALGEEAVASPAQAGRRADARGFERMVEGDLEGTLAAWRRAADLHAAAGDEERRQAALSRIGAVLCGRPETFGEGLAVLEGAVAHLDEHAAGSRRAVSARLRLAMTLNGAGRPDEALAALDRVTPGDHPLDRPDLELSRARVLIDLPGRRSEAVAALRLACAGYREAAAPAILAEAALLLGGLLAETEPDAEEAGHLLTEAVVNAPADAPGLRSAAYASRGGWLLAHDRPAEAVEDLVEAVAGFTAVGARPQAAHARVELAAAYYAAERPLEAAEVAEEAIPMLCDLGDRPAERRARYLLANALREFGEHEAAAETFTALAADEERPATAAGLFEAAGELLSGLDKDGAAAERFAEAAARHTEAGHPLGAAQAYRRRGMCLLWCGRPEDGLAAMGQAADGLVEQFRRSGDGADDSALIWEQAMLAYDRARVLAALGRTAEALEELDQAVAGFTALGRPDAAAAATELRNDIAPPSSP